MKVSAFQDHVCTPSLDEVTFYHPGVVQWLGGINSNTVLRYFAESPFFDRTSNNATLITQATYNPSMTPMIFNRQAFESRLRTMQGLEYMISYEPQHTVSAAPGEEQCIWVIRKQNRRKVQGNEDELMILGAYYVVRETIYQSPSVYNIISSRMLSSVIALTKLVSRASATAHFTPALGHTYFDPTAKPSASAAVAAGSQARESKDPTPMPGSRSPSLKLPTMVPPNSKSPSVSDQRTLVESFNLAVRYANEYMDENPLLGEPGAFVFASTNERLKAQQQRAALQASSKHGVDVRSSPSATPQPLSPEKPDMKATQRKASAGDEKIPLAAAGAAPKPKRRKSKAVGTPVSVNATTPAG